ncbi:MAG: hypothetical protein WDN26_00240 [Chitinophagaceae bacterium]
METLFLLLTLGVLVEAAVFQVTSYTPPDNNIFFHSFAIAYILTSISRIIPLRMSHSKMAIVFSLGILLWWSNVYWKYIQKIVGRAFPSEERTISSTGENVVNRKTFMIPAYIDTSTDPVSKWVFFRIKNRLIKFICLHPRQME